MLIYRRHDSCSYTDTAVYSLIIIRFNFNFLQTAKCRSGAHNAQSLRLGLLLSTSQHFMTVTGIRCHGRHGHYFIIRYVSVSYSVGVYCLLESSFLGRKKLTS